MSMPDLTNYRALIGPIPPDERERMRGKTWHPGLGCPGFERLARLSLTHWDLEGQVQEGVLEVAVELAPELAEIFQELFRARFPIARMRPMHLYDGDDTRSMLDNNSSAFNCRCKVGGSELSLHSFGRALDLNPVQNPYESKGGLVLPDNGRPFARRDGRTITAPGVLYDGHPAVQCFERRGWTWGGRWNDPKDWQHFEKG